MTVARKPGLAGDAVAQKAHEEAATPLTKPPTPPATSSCVSSKPAEESLHKQQRGHEFAHLSEYQMKTDPSS